MPAAILRFQWPRAGWLDRITGRALARFSAGDLLGVLPPDGATVRAPGPAHAAGGPLTDTVEGLTPEFKYALLTGAVTGGGLTLIANAPNPAGASILKGTFEHGAIAAHGLFAGALGPTLIAILCFRLFPL